MINVMDTKLFSKWITEYNDFQEGELWWRKGPYDECVSYIPSFPLYYVVIDSWTIHGRWYSFFHLPRMDTIKYFKDGSTYYIYSKKSKKNKNIFFCFKIAWRHVSM